ncbi:stabilin-2-like [Acropora muricata]|uniref:stabilin-2-like n=1 Tax=Acropora muricata TaxID=159855 RepID=UPI0034E560FD
MAKRSTIPLNGCLSLVLLWLFSLAIARRCDRSVTVRSWSRCMECSLNRFQRCPRGYSTLTSGNGIQRCSYLINFGANFGHIAVIGCQHLCSRRIIRRECCAGFWGRDCQACPGVPSCSGRGSCNDRINGNGTCSCQNGFKGFGCELCQDSSKFGSNCNQTCPCLHGECESGVYGTGHCKPDSCHLGYTGQDCNTTLPGCVNNNRTCGANAGCYQINGTDTCVCNPGYRNSSNNCTAIDHCRENTHGCHKNSDCHYLGPGKHQCTCSSGYTGDGIVCVEIDPCQRQNGGCPTNSTVCNYLQPGKSNCSCLPGFQNFSSGTGCSLIKLCENGGGCHLNANCTMEGPGVKRCDCKQGYRGNGSVCYGNIIQRVNELNVGGPDIVKGNLTTAIDLLTGSFVHQALSGTGPFTLFLMVDSAFANLTHEQKSELTANLDMASHFVSRHLVAGDLDSIALKTFGQVTTLQGINATITELQSTLYFKLDGHFVNATVLLSDLLAGNGMIHVIDKIMWHVEDYHETSSTPSLQVLYGENRFSTFVSLLESSGIAAELNGLGAQYTLLVPVNSAFEKLDNSTFRFLIESDEGRRKMKSLLRNHILTGKFTVLDLIYNGKVRSVEGESLVIKLTRSGRIIVDENGHVIDSNILTSDGVLHVLDTIVIPDDIQPLLPRYCNTKIERNGVCYRCSAVQAMPRKGCQAGYFPSSSTRRCFYRLFYASVFIGTFVGCRSSCSVEIPECCPGFYGRPCHPCPGPFHNPCNGHGKCLDKVAGNGNCICEAQYKGFACELCQKDDKFGPLCNQTCTCLYGKCDKGPKGNGTCVPHSCSPGFHGDNCDQHDTPCIDPSNSRRCHAFASCVRIGIVDSCQCNAGYEGSGTQCSEIDPCSKPNQGGCHHEAFCTKTGPGTNNCTCGVGFRGDGISCVPIDPCLEMGGGYCHSNAECQYVSPGQSTCVCKAGYTGNGARCNEINPCLVNNGGCSSNARCIRTGPGNHSCQCNDGYIVNGDFCLESVAKIIGKIDPKLEDYVRQANLLHYLSDPRRNLTMFAASSLALSQIPRDEAQYWTNSTSRLQYLVQHHILDQAYNLKELRSMSSVNASNGGMLRLSNQGQTVIIDGVSHIVQANITAENGFVHVIDKVLLPSHLSYEKHFPLTSELLKETAEFSEFYNILKRLQLLSSLDACQSCTVFAPTNSALKKLNITVTAATIKYHVVKRYLSIESVRNGEEYSTWLGDPFPLKITKLSRGRLLVNGIIVMPNGQKARKAVVFGLNGVLEPVKRNCDVINRPRGYGGCTFCPPFAIPRCPGGWTRLGIWYHSCRIFFFSGCRAICQRTVVIKRCCKGFWGPDCQSCPGNLSSPCSNNGQCGDGISGNGHCQCSANFTGTACEKCIPGKYGVNCVNECNCVNGTCNEGVHGDGSCLCRHGWKGALCNESANFQNCLPKKCSSHATCRGPSGNGTCDCDAGYTGNGTHCAAIDTCLVNNGGCHSNANCSIDLSQPSFRSCKCHQDFEGDGEVCIAIDPCQVNNGGCHENATCVNTGPNKRNCFCKVGYTGDGFNSCVTFDPCELDNGGCSARADCIRTGPYERKCVCRGNYVGDGFTCIGDITEALTLDPQLSEIARLIMKYGLDKLLRSHGNFNLLAPVNDAFKKTSSRKRRSVNAPSSTEEMVLHYHILSCVRFIPINGDSQNFTTLLGPSITVKTENNVTSFSDSFGNVSRVVGVYEAPNGVVLKLDGVLSPPPSPESNPMASYAEVARSLGYSEFLKLVELAGLAKKLDVQVNKPLLLFWPTNNAIKKLPTDLLAKLRDPTHSSELIQFVQYHVVIQVQADFSSKSFLRSGVGLELRTLGRSSLFVSCRGGQGDLYVNGESRIIARDVNFNGGIAFGVDKALIPLGFGGNCDELQESHVTGPCGNCFLPRSCPQDTTLTHTTNHSCTYSGDLLGCQPICLQKNKVKRCCKNHYGPNCVACPGGVQLPCSRRGYCVDGLQGNGTCICDSRYSGMACERCNTSFCPAPSVDCKADNGGCHVFAICSQTAIDKVNCSCKGGYHGDGYYCELSDVCLINNGDCDNNATCLFTGPGTRRCRCKAGFYQVGSTCQPHQPNSRCAQNHGGCSFHADCIDNGNGVTCSCRAGFAGDGFTCEGTIIEVLLETTEAKEFFKVLYDMSLKSNEASSLYEALQKPSNSFTVFVPVNSAVVSKKFTVHVLKNHILAGRLPLNNLTGDFTVTTLAGTKLLIRKLPNGEVSINGVAHIVGDIPAVNGLVHMIDQMIPVTSPLAPTTAPPAPLTNKTSQPVRQSTDTVEPTKAPSTKSEPTQKTETSSTEKPSAPDIKANARKQESSSVGGGAITGIIIATILVVLLIGFLLFQLKKRHMPSRAFYKKKGDTVHFSNEAYSGTGIVSFDNVLFDNMETEPVLMQPLDFPLDDKQALPQGQALEHVDFDNPIYREIIGLDSQKHLMDPFSHTPNQGSEHIDFENPIYGVHGHPNSDGTVKRRGSNKASPEDGVRAFANPMFKDTPNSSAVDRKLTLDSRFVPGQEDTC